MCNLRPAKFDAQCPVAAAAIMFYDSAEVVELADTPS